MLIMQGQLWSPYYIMVKDNYELDFRQLFELLKIQRYCYKIKDKKIEIGKKSSDVLFVIRRDHWIQIMDNWGYHLWHNENIRIDIQNLAKSFEIFQYSIGDTDYSYDFSYYKDRKLRVCLNFYQLKTNTL